jgi:DNA repair exonuclease SbcCD ATPase subunit
LIIFKKLRWKNLLSTGNVFTEIDLTAKNTTLIIGENGAGKSTILDAISFGLFGKPFRKVNKGQLINSINNKGLLVEVEFSVGSKSYIVKRGSKPTVFEVYQDDTLINLDASAGDYQEMLDKHILKISHKTFSQIVVLGSASFVPFMQMTAAHRREVIEDLLDIQIFTIMNTLLKDKVGLNKSEIMEADYAIHGIDEKIELEQQHLQEIKNNNEELISQKQQQIITIQGEVNEANINIEQNQAEILRQTDHINDQDKIRSRREKVVALVRQLDNKHDQIRKENEFFLSNNDCPTCRQGIAHDHRNQIVDSGHTQLDEIKQAQQKISKELNRLDARLTTIADVTRTIAGINQEVYNALSGVRIKEGFIKSIQNEINQLNTSTHTEININRLAELKKQFKEQTQKREMLGRERVTLETASVLLKDTGIKTKIIRQYVPVINKLINKYLASMDFFVNFELNESFEETLKSRFRDEFSYASFSEGEKSRIDLALLFTWRAISKLRNSTSTNLLILDEVFDGSLDSQGNEELLKIIQTLTEGNNVFVISHKTDAYIDKFDRVLKFEKQKNFSTMVEL